MFTKNKNFLNIFNESIIPSKKLSIKSTFLNLEEIELITRNNKRYNTLPNTNPSKFLKKYIIKNKDGDIIKFNSLYSTDDEDEYNIINIINEPVTEGYELAVSSNLCKVYTKGDENCKTILLKSIGNIPYPFPLVKKIIGDEKGMDEWDTTFKCHTLIKEFPKNDNFVMKKFYFYIPFPFPMTDRDLVQLNKVWYNYNGKENILLQHMKSTTDENYPEKTKPIRSDLIIGGYYLVGKENNTTDLYMINKLDLKVTTGASIVNSVAPKSPAAFFENLTKRCKKLSS